MNLWGCVPKDIFLRKIYNLFCPSDAQKQAQNSDIFSFVKLSLLKKVLSLFIIS